MRGERLDKCNRIVHVPSFEVEQRAVGGVAIEMRHRRGNGANPRHIELRRRDIVEQRTTTLRIPDTYSDEEQGGSPHDPVTHCGLPASTSADLETQSLIGIHPVK
jgi:hypothetical protein